MSDDVFNFEERRRERDQNPDQVRCAHCGAMILATVIRYTECGVHFQGEAQDFIHANPRRGQPSARRTSVIVAAVTLVLALLLTLAGPR